MSALEVIRVPIKFPEYGNVRAKVALSLATHKPTFVLEALDYDTLWRMYVAYVLSHPSWAGDDDAMRMIIYLAESSVKVRKDLDDNDSDWQIVVSIADIVNKLQIPFKKVNWIWKEMCRKGFIDSSIGRVLMPGFVRWPLQIQQQPPGWYTFRHYGIRINYHVKSETII